MRPVVHTPSLLRHFIKWSCNQIERDAHKLPHEWWRRKQHATMVIKSIAPATYTLVCKTTYPHATLLFKSQCTPNAACNCMARAATQ
jgi:hypothetical protein